MREVGGCAVSTAYVPTMWIRAPVPGINDVASVLPGAGSMPPLHGASAVTGTLKNAPDFAHTHRFVPSEAIAAAANAPSVLAHGICAEPCSVNSELPAAITTSAPTYATASGDAGAVNSSPAGAVAEPNTTEMLPPVVERSTIAILPLPSVVNSGGSVSAAMRCWPSLTSLPPTESVPSAA